MSEASPEADTVEPNPPARGAHTFRLSDELASFADFVISRTVPHYKTNYQKQIEREWKRVAQRFADKTPATQKLYVSKFRKAIEMAVIAAEKNQDRHDGILSRIKRIVKNDPAIIELVNETYSAKVVENTRRLVLVRHYREIVGVARAWLDDEDDGLVAIALMLLTGRRFYEVLVAGAFSPAIARIERGSVRGSLLPKWALTFHGQLKTREAEGTKFDQSFIIPTLAPVGEILTALQRLRRSPLGQFAAAAPQETANTNVNPKLNRLLRRSEIARLWPAEDPDFSLKSTRALYAEICYKYHAPAGIHKDTYFAQILGHREGDLRTALSYVRYYLEEKDGDDARAEMLRIAAEQERQARAYAEQRATDEFDAQERVRAKALKPRTSRDLPAPGDVAPEAIKERIRQKGIEISQFAESIGRHRSTIWRNLVASGNPEIHSAIAQLLDVPRSALWPSRYGAED